MQVICGKPEYVKRKVAKYAKNGYVPLERKQWSDGTITVKLAKVM